MIREIKGDKEGISYILSHFLPLSIPHSDTTASGALLKLESNLKFLFLYYFNELFVPSAPLYGSQVGQLTSQHKKIPWYHLWKSWSSRIFLHSIEIPDFNHFLLISIAFAATIRFPLRMNHPRLSIENCSKHPHESLRRPNLAQRRETIHRGFNDCFERLLCDHMFTQDPSFVIYLKLQVILKLKIPILSMIWIQLNLNLELQTLSKTQAHRFID